MAQSWHHAETSARHFGGVPDDYIAIHQWLDDRNDVGPDGYSKEFCSEWLR